MPINNVFASLAVKNLKESSRWYERLFGRPPDSTPMHEVVEWQFAGGGWLQVYELAERAGACSCTLAVSNFEEELSKLARLGIDTSEQSRSTAAKIVMIADPDGNHIAFAEALDPRMAR